MDREEIRRSPRRGTTSVKYHYSSSSSNESNNESNNNSNNNNARSNIAAFRHLPNPRERTTDNIPLPNGGLISLYLYINRLVAGASLHGQWWSNVRYASVCWLICNMYFNVGNDKTSSICNIKSYCDSRLYSILCGPRSMQSPVSQQHCKLSLSESWTRPQQSQLESFRQFALT